MFIHLHGSTALIIIISKQLKFHKQLLTTIFYNYIESSIPTE